MTRNVSDEKKALRNSIRAKVAQLPADYCQKADAAIRAYVLSLPEYQHDILIQSVFQFLQ